VQSIAIFVSVCLSVRSHISKNICPNFTSFCTLPVAMAQFSPNAIHYSLLFLWMTSCLHIMVQMTWACSMRRSKLFTVTHCWTVHLWRSPLSLIALERLFTKRPTNSVKPLKGTCNAKQWCQPGKPPTGFSTFLIHKLNPERREATCYPLYASSPILQLSHIAKKT